MGVLLIDAEPVLDLIHRHLDQFLIKLLEIRCADPVYPVFRPPHLWPDTGCSHQCRSGFDVPVLQIHLFEGVQFIIHHILKYTKNCLDGQTRRRTDFPTALRFLLDILGRNQAVLIEREIWKTSKADIRNGSSFLDDLLELCLFHGNGFIALKTCSELLITCTWIPVRTRICSG